MKDKKLTIAILDFDDVKNPMLNGGQAKTTLEIGKILVKRGHKVNVYCAKYPGAKDRVESGINYRHIGKTFGSIKFDNLLYVLTAGFYARKIKADIIIECFTAPVSTLMSPLFTKVPVIGLGTSFEADRFSKLYHLPLWIIEKFGVRFYKYFIAYNPSHEQKIKTLNKKIVAVTIPEGVEDKFLKLKRQSPSHILFLGRFDMNQKGIDLLLKSYKKAKEKIGLPLVIIGFGPDEEKIKAMVKELGLEKDVKFLGPQYGDEKMNILSRSLFVVIPSRSESFSLFTLESIASGAPVSIFRIPGLSWVSEKVSLRAKPFSVDEYAKNLIKLSDKNLIKKMSKDSKEFAKDFTWDKVVDQFENFFVSVLKN